MLICGHLSYENVMMSQKFELKENLLAIVVRSSFCTTCAKKYPFFKSSILLSQWLIIMLPTLGVASGIFITIQGFCLIHFCKGQHGEEAELSKVFASL